MIRLFTLAIFGCTSLIAGTTAAHASTDPLEGIPDRFRANEYNDLPPCTNIVTTFCIESFQIDLNKDGVFETPNPNLQIAFTANLFSVAKWNTPSLSFNLYVNNNQELSPTIPIGTAFTYSINTGAFKPTPSLFASSEVVSFDVRQVNGNWITSGTSKTYSFTFGMRGNTPGSGLINYDQDKKDYKSFAGGGLFYETPSAMTESKTGMWVYTNAAMTGELKFDTSTLTWKLPLAGPAKKADGSTNELIYTSFLPDTFIVFAYGTTPDVLRNSLVMTRTDGDITTKVDATITRVTSPIPGLIVKIPDIRLYGTVVTKKAVSSMGSRYTLNPTIRIAPKFSLLKSPKTVRVKMTSSNSLQIVGAKVFGASRYEAMCTSGRTFVSAKSRSASVTVSNLTSGRWSCRIRGLSKLGGRWSPKKTINIA